MLNLKKWAPLLGGVVLIAANIAELTGQADIAAGLRGVGGATGVTNQAPFGAADVTAFLSAAVGVWTLGRGLIRKFTSEWQKARTLAPSQPQERTGEQ